MEQTQVDQTVTRKKILETLRDARTGIEADTLRRKVVSNTQEAKANQEFNWICRACITEGHICMNADATLSITRQGADYLRISH